MTIDGAVELVIACLLVWVKTAGPALIGTLIVGVGIGVLQAATQINEASIGFLAKLIVMAVTLAALGVGIGYALSASSAEDEYESLRSALPSESACNPGVTNPPPACAELPELLDRENKHRTISNVAFAAAGVSALAAGLTIVLWKPETRKSAVMGVRPQPGGAAFDLRVAF